LIEEMVGEINQDVVYLRFFLYEEYPSESGGVVGDDDEVFRSLKTGGQVAGIS